MESRGLALKQLLISILVLLGSAAVPYGVLQLFLIFFADFYQTGFLTGMSHILYCMGIMFIHAIVSLSLMNNFWREKNNGLDGTRFIKYLLIYLAIALFVQVGLNIVTENPFKDPPAPSFF
ncbi:hypothetical protein P40081_09485 [Paenibacillus sp. FSL P4-0081]|nr:hypothetical protein P40081_09485 [Paenibacillus sp. FSL P4-0081]